MVLSNHTLLRSRWFLETISQVFGVSKPFKLKSYFIPPDHFLTLSHDNGLPKPFVSLLPYGVPLVTAVKFRTYSLRFSLSMPKDTSYYARFVP